MPKFFVKSEQIDNNEIKIIGTDVNHIKNVLRLNLKEKIEITCQDCKETYLCEINIFDKNSVNCNIIEKLEKLAEPNVYIHIFQGLPKIDKMEWIIEKGTEIGISEFTPIEMKRCVVKLDEKNKIKKQDRWSKIAEVAAKQSGRECIPQINKPVNIKNIYENFEKYDIVLVAYEKEEKRNLKNVLMEYKNCSNLKIAVIIGPEGGIDTEELKMLVQNGATSISLGKRILRTETAPLMISSNIIYEFEE